MVRFHVLQQRFVQLWWTVILHFSEMGWYLFLWLFLWQLITTEGARTHILIRESLKV